MKVLCLFLLMLALLLSGCGRARPPATPIPAPTSTILSVPTSTNMPTPTAGPTPTPTDVGMVVRRDETIDAPPLPGMLVREALFATVLASEQPILLLPDVDGPRQEAQLLAATDETVRRLTRDSLTDAPLRAEVFSIRPALPSDFTAEDDAGCTPDTCYRVEIYNYPLNLTIVALVNVEGGQVLDAGLQNDTQPEVPAHLAELATEIAVNAPEVQAALGFDPTGDDAVMPHVKSALNGSRCERSRHLCVAPTFLLHDEGRALWAIVDLTDGQLVGTRWTDLGNSSGVPVTEQALQDAVVMTTYCEQAIPLARDGWRMDYILTSSDGLAVVNATYAGQPVIRSLKLPDWHVSYSRTDGFGYSDATGCPMFSTASVVAFNGPRVEDVVVDGEAVGFAIVQDFRSELWPLACNYRYEQRYEFYADGRFRVSGGNLGQGCGNDGTYRPVLRLDLVTADGSAQSVAEWDGVTWEPWTEEGWTLQSEETPLTPEGYQFQISDGDGDGYYLAPNVGQFDDGSRGDNAFVYVTAHRPEEGDADMLTIGPCCNDDYRQGPEKFMEPPESLGDENDDLVLWYVSQLKNEDTPGEEYCWTTTVVVDGKLETEIHPCYFGPMFTPIQPAGEINE